eukprot:jgi/Mesvir1/21040/Mv08088-RA.1
MSARQGIDAPKFTRPVSKYSSKFVPTSTGTPAVLARPALSGAGYLDSIADADAAAPSSVQSFGLGDSRERKKHEDPPASHTSYLQARAEQRGGDVFDRVAGFLRASSRRTCGIGLAFILTILLALVVIDIAYTDLDEVAQVEGIGPSSGTDVHLAALQASDVSSLRGGGDDASVSPAAEKLGKKDGGAKGKKGKKKVMAVEPPAEAEEPQTEGSDDDTVGADSAPSESAFEESQPSGTYSSDEQREDNAESEAAAREAEEAAARERQEAEEAAARAAAEAAAARQEAERKEQEQREAEERERQEREAQEARKREEAAAREAREREVAAAREALEREEAAAREAQEQQRQLAAAALAAKREAFPVYEGEVQLAGYVPARCRLRSVMEHRRRRLLAVPPKAPKGQRGVGGPVPKGPRKNWEMHAANWDRVIEGPAPTKAPGPRTTRQGPSARIGGAVKQPAGSSLGGYAFHGGLGEGIQKPPLGSPGNRPDVVVGAVPDVPSHAPMPTARRTSQNEVLPEKVFYSPSANADVVRHVLGLLKRPHVACSDVGIACGDQGKKFGLMLSPGVFGSCAVVGLGPNLKGKARGKEIDGHDTVIRLGLAPIKGFTMDVGHKMSIVYMRRHSSPHSDIYDSTLRSETFDVKVFWRSDPPRFGNSQLFGTTGYGRNDDGAIGLMEDVALGKMTRRPFLRTLALSNSTADKELYRLLEKYVTHRDNSIVEYGPSHGFHVVNTILASGLCKTVDLYGFTENMRGHYFPEGIVRQGYEAGEGIVPGLEYFVYRLMMANNLACLYD